MIVCDIFKLSVSSAALALGAGVASAATVVEYTFHDLGGERVSCVASGDPRVGTGIGVCNNPQTVGGPPPVEVSSNVGPALFDVGYGAGPNTTDDKIWPGETIKFAFPGLTATLASLDLVYFTTQSQSIDIFASNKTTNVSVNNPTDFWVATGANPSQPFPYVPADEQFFTQVPVGVTGSMFEIQPVVGSDGFFVAAATFEFEEDEPSEVPVPPAAPLLGGALALLAWGARRSKRA